MLSIVWTVLFNKHYRFQRESSFFFNHTYHVFEAFLLLCHCDTAKLVYIIVVNIIVVNIVVVIIISK